MTDYKHRDQKQMRLSQVVILEGKFKQLKNSHDNLMNEFEEEFKITIKDMSIDDETGSIRDTSFI